MSMKTYFARVWTPSVLLLLTLRAIASAATWTGAGGDDFWSTPANWGGTALSGGDALLFGGSTRTSPNNDFPPRDNFRTHSNPEPGRRIHVARQRHRAAFGYWR